MGEGYAKIKRGGMDMIETKDLILRKASFEDWRPMYENVWSREETAKFMFWDVTRSEEDARSRMERTIAFQKVTPFGLTVIEKATGNAIGFAGMKEIEPGVFEDIGVALGPEFVGKGYGKQILSAFVEELFNRQGAKKIICSCRSQNEASRQLQLSCGFTFSHTEEKVDPRNGEPYVLEFYELKKRK